MTIDPELLELEPITTVEEHDLEQISRAVIELAELTSEMEEGITHIEVTELQIDKVPEATNSSSASEQNFHEESVPLVEDKNSSQPKRISRSNRNSREDSTSQYLNDIGQIPLLEGYEEEAKLAQLIEHGKSARARLEANPEKYTDKEKEADARAVQEGEAARQDFIKANLRLVIKYARQVKKPGSLSFMDLVQEGNLGLEHAVEKFDYRKGFKFSTYATWWIRQAISRALDQKASTIRLPGRVAANYRRAWYMIDEGATDEEVCAELDISTEEFGELMNSAGDPSSLDRKVGEGEELNYYGIVADPQATEEFTNFEDTEAVTPIINLAKEILNSDDFEYLMFCFGFIDGKKRTNPEIGAYYGVEGEQARQRKHKLTTKVRAAAKLYGLNDTRDY